MCRCQACNRPTSCDDSLCTSCQAAIDKFAKADDSVLLDHICSACGTGLTLPQLKPEFTYSCFNCKLPMEVVA